MKLYEKMQNNKARKTEQKDKLVHKLNFKLSRLAKTESNVERKNKKKEIRVILLALHLGDHITTRQHGIELDTLRRF